MLYLPRLFVYHCEFEIGSKQSETFKLMERRLLKAIVNPAICTTLSSQSIAEAQTKSRFLAMPGGPLLWGEVTIAIAETWARSKGATEGEIEAARQCLKVQTAQGTS